MIDIESNETRATYKVDEGATFTKSFNFYYKYRNGIEFNYYRDLDTICTTMKLYRRDKNSYFEYTGIIGDNVTNEARITKLLTAETGTFHRGFTNMVRSNGDTPNRSIHYFRNQLQDGIAPYTYDEFKASSNFSNWTVRS